MTQREIKERERLHRKWATGKATHMVEKHVTAKREREMRETLRHFREWFANHFEDFDSETNGQLLCLDNEAAYALGDES